MKKSARLLCSFFLSLFVCFAAPVVFAESLSGAPSFYSENFSESFLVTLNCSGCSTQSESLMVLPGEAAVFTVTPDPGYDFYSVSGGATYSETTTGNTRTGTVIFENVTESTEIDLIFIPRPAITLSVGHGEGSVGSVINIPINISENSRASVGVCNIFYDADTLEFVGTNTSGCVPTGNINVELTPSTGKLGMYFISRNLGQEEITAGGPLIYMTFIVKEGAAPGEIPLLVYPGSSENHNTYINDLECTREVLTESGKINILSPDDGKHILKTAVYNDVGGKVSTGGRLAPGESITLKATASVGYVFSHWEAESGSFSSVSSTTTSYTMGEADVTVYAHFVRRTYSVAISCNEGGEVQTPASSVEYGSDLTITLIAYPGYELYSLRVGNVLVTDEIVDGSYTIRGVTSSPRIAAAFVWRGAEIIEEIFPLRSYDVSFNNTRRTITVNAYNTNTSAGFGLKIADEGGGSYKGEADKNLSKGTKDGINYIVARRSAGYKQNFDLYINYMGYEYTYKVTLNFTHIPITDFVTTGASSVVIDTETKNIEIKSDFRFQNDVGFAFILPESVAAEYEPDAYFTAADSYTAENDGYYGAIDILTTSYSKGVTQYFYVTLTDTKGVCELYTVRIAYRDLSYEGDITPTALVPLRLSNYSLDTENKVIYAVSEEGASSSGISFSFDNMPPVRYTAKSGQGLVTGIKDGYKYLVCRRSNGESQTLLLKVYGQDGYEYSWYTVYMQFI